MFHLFTALSRAKTIILLTVSYTYDMFIDVLGIIPRTPTVVNIAVLLYNLVRNTLSNL